MSIKICKFRSVSSITRPSCLPFSPLYSRHFYLPLLDPHPSSPLRLPLPISHHFPYPSSLIIMPLIHVMILLFLGVHSIIIPHAFAHLSLRTGANTTLSFPTASYYGQITKSESFLHTGILHPVHFSKGCKLLPPRSPTPGEDEAIQQGLAARSILWISAGEAANNGGCMSYGTINDQIVSYIQRLPGQGWPLPLAILYHSMARNEDDVFGGPMPSLEMYTSRDVVSSESMPPLDALMVSADHGLDLMRTMGSTNRTWGIVDLQLEPGPWNRVHFHPAYLTYEYILLTAVCT